MEKEIYTVDPTPAKEAPPRPAGAVRWVVQAGFSGFPGDPSAATERLRLMGMGLLHAGMQVRVLNRKGVFTPEEGIDVPPQGVSDGMDYIYAGGTIFRPPGFLQRNWLKVYALWQEYRLLRKWKKRDQLDLVIVHSMDFGDLVFYRVLAMLLGFRMVYQLVELNSSMQSRQGWRIAINDFLLEKIGLSLPHAILPISHYLEQYLQERFPRMPLFKVPIICDFQHFSTSRHTEAPYPYFLYCGSLNYQEVVRFILEAFDQLETTAFHLHLVLSGSDEQKAAINAHIASMRCAQRVRLLSRLPYEELIAQYAGAKGLLIPLRPTVQDKARFPHKIGEYLASGNPVISTQLGEVQHFFTDKENAILAASYDVPAFAKAMQFVIDHPEDAAKIGKQGKDLGWQAFDCKLNGERLSGFLADLEE